MAEITSLEQCFSISKISRYVIALDEINDRLNNEIIKVADENLFGKSAFYCGNSHVTVKEKVHKANKEIQSTEKKVKELKNLIYKKSYEQRVADLSKYIDYLNGEIAKGEANINKYQNLLDTQYPNIREESDFGNQTRFNAANITAWRVTRISKDNQYAALDHLYQELEKAKAELTNAKIMVMHNFI